MPEAPHPPNTPPAAGNFILVIDLGTGGPKAGVVDDAGHVLAHAGRKVTTHLLPGGGAEQDPEEWWSRALEAARESLDASGAPPEQVRAVACTSQWSVVVPVDESGRALMRAVHWLDTRGAAYNQAVTRGFPSVQGYGAGKLWSWLRRTGMAPTHSGVDSLGHILFLKNERPEIYARTYKFLEPMDYLTFRLTGRCTASQIVALLDCPAVRRRFALAEPDLDLIERWLAETRVCWGIDAQSRSAAGLPARVL